MPYSIHFQKAIIKYFLHFKQNEPIITCIETGIVTIMEYKCKN